MKQINTNKEYQDYVNLKSPNSPILKNCFNSFWVGGLICVLGQAINDGLLALFPTLAEQSAWGYTLIILIFIASFLTGIGIFDDIGKFAGAGTLIPITGFSNSIASPAIEFKNEGIIFGMCVKMFVIAGPVLVTGIVASGFVGLVYLIIGVI